MPVILHERLQADCFVVCKLSLSLLLLRNDCNYPWFILVPQRAAVREIYQLSDTDQQQLMRESSALAACIETEFKADKINIAALGNVVPQLHIHHIVRYHTDAAWPDPVWGKMPEVAYDRQQAEQLCTRVSGLLTNL